MLCLDQITYCASWSLLASHSEVGRMKVSEVWRTREFPGSIFDTIQQENAFIPSPGIGDESMEKHFTYISLSACLDAEFCGHIVHVLTSYFHWSSFSLWLLYWWSVRLKIHVVCLVFSSNSTGNAKSRLLGTFSLWYMPFTVRSLDKLLLEGSIQIWASHCVWTALKEFLSLKTDSC